MEDDPRHKYINLFCTADESTQNITLQPSAIFRENRFAPVLEDAGAYQFAVARFQIGGERLLPAFVPTIELNQSNPFLTSYKISLSLTTKRRTTPYPLLDLQPILYAQAFTQEGTVGPAVSITCNYVGGTTIDAWKDQINTAIRAIPTTPIISSLLCQTTGIPSNGRLQWGYEALAVTGKGVGVRLWSSNADAGFFGLVRNPVVGVTEPFVVLQAVYPYTSDLYFTQSPEECFQTDAVGPTFTGSYQLVWTPQCTHGNPPIPPISTGFDPMTGSPIPAVQDSSCQQLWAYDYQWVVNNFNYALQKAHENLVARAFAEDVYLVQTAPPFIKFDKATRLFSLYADALSSPTPGYPQGFSQGVEFLSITFNTTLSDLLLLPSSYDDKRNGTLNFLGSSLALQSYPLPVSASFGSPGLVAPASNTQWACITNDSSPLGSGWSPVAALSFQSSFIPVRSETACSPLLYSALSPSAGSLLTSYGSERMLSDFAPDVAESADWRTNTMIYAPTFLRWADMPAENLKLQFLDFGVKWLDCRTGLLQPLFLSPGCYFYAKLVVRRKDIID